MKFHSIVSCVLFAAGSLLWAEPSDVYVDNVVIILDASGSMNNSMKSSGERRIDSARLALKEVIRSLPPTTQVGLLVFSKKLNGWAFKPGPRDDQQLFKVLDGIEAEGGTPLGEYLKTGADQLLQERKRQFGYGSYRLLVLTDGEAGDAKKVEDYTPDIMSRGIVIDVIGVDMAAAHTLATKVHSYRRANDPASLKQALQEIFAEVDQRNSQGGAGQAFEDLAPLPGDLALSVLKALASSGDAPIGSPPTSRDPQTSPPQLSNPQAAPPQSAHPQGQPQSAPQAIDQGGVDWKLWFILAVVAFVFLNQLRRRS